MLIITPTPFFYYAIDMLLMLVLRAVSCLYRENAGGGGRRKGGLTRAETVQLVNLRPSTAVELHAIVEECAERLSDAQVAKVLALVAARRFSAEHFSDASAQSC